MLRANSNAGFCAFMDNLQRQFSDLDMNHKGIIERKDAKGTLVELHGELPLIEEILPCFTDSSELVRWVEMKAFLCCCSAWYAMRHLHRLDLIRKKQGTPFSFSMV